VLRWTYHSITLGSTETLSRPAVRSFLHHGTAAQLSGVVNDQAAILSYADATLTIALISVVCVPLVLLMRKKKAPVGRTQPIHTASAEIAW
jgi:hypothetical protein